MVHIAVDNSGPTDVTFFVGPPGAPQEIRETYERALACSVAGDRVPLDEFLDNFVSTLRGLADDSPQDPSPLKQTLEILIDHRIGEFFTYVDIGYTRKTWTPILTIHLDRLRGTDGSAIGHRVQKHHGEHIAAMLGLTFKAEWIYTSWVYRGTPIDNPLSQNYDNAEEGE